MLGGFYLLNCKDLDEALSWAAQIPGAWHGRVEVRPIIDFSGEAGDRSRTRRGHPDRGWPGGGHPHPADRRHRRRRGRASRRRLVATETWARDGVPDKPGAWLTTVARNKALDRLRREARADRQGGRGGAPAHRRPRAAPAGDDRLRLLFTCCHPALSIESQVALALRTLCGLTTVEIARAFLVPEATAGQRISRAKAKIARATDPVPDPRGARAARAGCRPCWRASTCVFTTGHDAPAGELARPGRPRRRGASGSVGCCTS